LANHPTISGYGLSALTLAIGAGMVAANTMPKGGLCHWRGDVICPAPAALGCCPLWASPDVWRDCGPWGRWCGLPLAMLVGT
jgi:hypothetical protein